MKKNLVKAIFVVVIVMVSGINMFSSQKSETLSEVALANVEALAADEDVDVCETIVINVMDGCVEEYMMVRQLVA